MMVWCGEKEECQCVVIHCIPGMLTGVCGLLLLSGGERRVVWRKVVEGKRRKSGKPKKHKSNCNSLKKPQLTLPD